MVGGIIIGGGALTYLGLNFLGKTESYDDQEVRDLTLTATLARIMTNEVVITQSGLTPTPGVKATIEAIATATATPVPNIEIPYATPTPDKGTVRYEKLSSQEVNPWDAAASLPANPDMTSMQAWFTEMQQNYTLGYLSEGDIRTFEQIREIAGNDATFWKRENYNNAFQSGDKKIWISANQEQFYQAKNAELTLKKYVSEYILAQGGSAGNSDLAFQILKDQLFAASGDRLVTRNTYPAQGLTRSSQPETEWCPTAYIGAIKVGQEFVKGGVLYLPNEAKTVFVFVESDSEIQVNDPTRLAHVPVKLPDGMQKHLYVRMFDLSSRPKPELFGNYGLVVDDEAEGAAGMQILPPCGEANVLAEIPTVTITPTPSPTQGQFNTERPPQTPQNTPPSEGTVTPAPTQSVQPPATPGGGSTPSVETPGPTGAPVEPIVTEEIGEGTPDCAFPPDC